MKILTCAVALALVAASPAIAGELPFGAPSEPTIFGHKVEPSHVRERDTLTPVRQTRPAPMADGRRASEPTIWGHAVSGKDRPDASQGE